MRCRSVVHAVRGGVPPGRRHRSRSGDRRASTGAVACDDGRPRADAHGIQGPRQGHGRRLQAHVHGSRPAGVAGAGRRRGARRPPPRRQRQPALHQRGVRRLLDPRQVPRAGLRADWWSGGDVGHRARSGQTRPGGARRAGPAASTDRHADDHLRVEVSIRRDRPDGTSGYAFPSGHASTTFATASVLEAHFGWKVGVPAYALATYVAASRLHENRHYLSDVVFGGALGMAAGRSATRHGRHHFALAPLAVPGGLGVVLTRISD